MQYHVPISQDSQDHLPDFMIHNGELICPEKVFRKKQYPNLKSDMVKIISMNGQKILVPIEKLGFVSAMDA